MPGFRKAEASGVLVNVNATVRLDMQLTAGLVDQTVEFTAAAPVLTAEGSNPGKVVPTKVIMDLRLFTGDGLGGSCPSLGQLVLGELLNEPLP